jgi:hypothetical protein
MGEDDKLKTLVGIVADVRAVLHNQPPPTAYYPYWQRVPDGVSMVVRTTGDPQTAAGAIRATLRGEDAQLPIQAIRTMEEVVDGPLAQRDPATMGVFVMLLVASLGICGVALIPWPAAGMRSAFEWRSRPAVATAGADYSARYGAGRLAWLPVWQSPLSRHSGPIIQFSRPTPDDRRSHCGVAGRRRLSLHNPSSPGRRQRCHRGTPIRVAHPAFVPTPAFSGYAIRQLN